MATAESPDAGHLIFAPGENIWELTYFGFLQEVTINDAQKSTSIKVSGLTRIKPPRPNKTRLVVCSTGHRLSSQRIRPYVLVEPKPCSPHRERGTRKGRSANLNTNV